MARRSADKAAPGAGGDVPSDGVNAYEQAADFCGKKLNAYSVIDIKKDCMTFYGVHDTILDTELSYAEDCLKALCEQFGMPYSYTVNDTGFTCDGTEPDYQTLFSEFSEGAENASLQFQWKNPCESVGRMSYRVTQRADGMEFYVYMYTSESLAG